MDQVKALPWSCLDPEGNPVGIASMNTEGNSKTQGIISIPREADPIVTRSNLRDLKLTELEPQEQNKDTSYGRAATQETIARGRDQPNDGIIVHTNFDILRNTLGLSDISPDNSARHPNSHLHSKDPFKDRSSVERRRQREHGARYRTEDPESQSDPGIGRDPPEEILEQKGYRKSYLRLEVDVNGLPFPLYTYSTLWKLQMEKFSKMGLASQAHLDGEYSGMAFSKYNRDRSEEYNYNILIDRSGSVIIVNYGQGVPTDYVPEMMSVALSEIRVGYQVANRRPLTKLPDAIMFRTY